MIESGVTYVYMPTKREKRNRTRRSNLSYVRFHFSLVWLLVPVARSAALPKYQSIGSGAGW